jgi:hypothetical protein
MRVFENRVLRVIFGSTREEAITGRRKLHNQDFHNLYSSSNIIKVINSRKQKRSLGNLSRDG